MALHAGNHRRRAVAGNLALARWRAGYDRVCLARGGRRSILRASGRRAARALSVLYRGGRFAHAGGPAHMILYERDGRLTRELLLAPGGFGLGQVPHGERPDATTTMTCGF